MDKFELQPMADVANNLIDKIANVIGWIATPRGEKAQEIEAQEYLIEQIKSDEKMPLLAKAAIISKSKKIITEYSNQNDIIQVAISQLGEKANPNGIENEWISFFMDSCKDIDDENIKGVWAKILAEECNNNGTVPKRLIEILRVISKEEADAFNRVMRFQMRLEPDHDGGFPILIIYALRLNQFFSDNGLKEIDLLNLDTIGLIQYNTMSGFEIEGKKITLSCADDILSVETENDTIPTGVAKFTREGAVLAKVLSSKPVNGFTENVYDFFKNRGLKVTRLR